MAKMNLPPFSLPPSTLSFLPSLQPSHSPPPRPPRLRRLYPQDIVGVLLAASFRTRLASRTRRPRRQVPSQPRPPARASSYRAASAPSRAGKLPPPQPPPTHRHHATSSLSHSSVLPPPPMSHPRVHPARPLPALYPQASFPRLWVGAAVPTWDRGPAPAAPGPRAQPRVVDDPTLSGRPCDGAMTRGGG